MSKHRIDKWALFWLSRPIDIDRLWVDDWDCLFTSLDYILSDSDSFSNFTHDKIEKTFLIFQMGDIWICLLMNCVAGLNSSVDNNHPPSRNSQKFVQIEKRDGSCGQNREIWIIILLIDILMNCNCSFLAASFGFCLSIHITILEMAPRNRVLWMHKTLNYAWFGVCHVVYAAAAPEAAAFDVVSVSVCVCKTNIQNALWLLILLCSLRLFRGNACGLR